MREENDGGRATLAYVFLSQTATTPMDFAPSSFSVAIFMGIHSMVDGSYPGKRREKFHEGG